MLAIAHPARRRAVLGAVVASALQLAACGGNDAAKAGGASGPQGAASAPPPPVGVVTVTPHDVSLLTELPGRVSAYLVSDVRPQVGGILQKRLFTEGADVKAGQTLYQIDPATYRAAYDSAKAALAKAQANAEVSKTNAERYKELGKIDAVSKQQADQAIATALQADADVESAKAALQTARINLDYTRITAPISGRIGRSSVTPGALLTANQTNALATVQQLDTIYVDVTQSSSELLRLNREIEAGRLQTDSARRANVRLKLEDGSTLPVTGKLQFADVTVDPSTNSVNLRATFPNPNKTLLPGMYVRAVLEEGVRQNAITVPQQAVSRDTKGDPMALVVGAGNKVEPRPLKTPRTVGDQWLVDSGLKAGDRVIVEGTQKARPGTVVQPVAPQGAASAPAAAAAPASGAASGSTAASGGA